MKRSKIIDTLETYHYQHRVRASGNAGEGNPMEEGRERTLAIGTKHGKTSPSLGCAVGIEECCVPSMAARMGSHRWRCRGVTGEIEIKRRGFRLGRQWMEGQRPTMMF